MSFDTLKIHKNVTIFTTHAYSQKAASYMVSEEKSLGFVSTDDGDIAESPLLSPLADNRAAANTELLIKDEVLHLLQKWKTQGSFIIRCFKVNSK